MNKETEAISSRAIVNFRHRLLAWGKKNYADFPWRSTKNLFHSLVAECMLQRTRAEQVVPIYDEFTKKYRRPSDVIDDQDVLDLLRPLGLYWRSRAMLRMIHELQSLGDLPRNTKGLRKLPGVGPYAAAAMVSFHTGKRAVIVDSNVVRIYGRYFGFMTDGETRRSDSFLKLANRITPSLSFKQFNYALLDHTRAICRPKPRCDVCPLNTTCHYGRFAGKWMNNALRKF
jgi:A/G-specific adenine glycosylase